MRGEVARVAARSKTDGVSWTIENLPEMNYVLIYGTAAASAVRVNGKILPKWVSESSSLPVWWKADGGRNRLVICLPLREIEHSDPVTEIEVEPA
jgi:hypothetical protein